MTRRPPPSPQLLRALLESPDDVTADAIIAARSPRTSWRLAYHILAHEIARTDALIFASVAFTSFGGLAAMLLIIGARP